MKKVLFLLTLALTLTLTGCKSEEEKIQDVLDDYTDLITSIFNGDEIDLDKECDAIFAEESAEECKVELNTNSTDLESPYYFELSFEVIAVEEVDSDNYEFDSGSLPTEYLEQFDKVFIVTIEVENTLQETLDSERYDENYDVDMIVVLIDGSYKIDVSVSTNVDE